MGIRKFLDSSKQLFKTVNQYRHFLLFCRWARFGEIKEVSYLGKDILCIYGGGCHLKFINTNTFKQLLFTANVPSKYGDGIKTVGCHRTIYLFAYAENCEYADLFIRTYPDFRLVQKISGK